MKIKLDVFLIETPEQSARKKAERSRDEHMHLDFRGCALMVFGGDCDVFHLRADDTKMNVKR